MITDKYLVKLKIRTPGLKSQIISTLKTYNVFEIQDDNFLGKTDLLMLELSQDLDREFNLVHRLSESPDIGEIFLASENSDSNILIRAIQAGAREFFGPNPTQDAIQEAINRFLQRQKKIKKGPMAKIGRIITILGAKGGVGTTTIAVNLATAIKNKEMVESVSLLDMNLFGDIHLFLGIDPTYSWSEITKNISRLDATFLKNILAVDPSGVQVLPSPGYLNNQRVTPEIIKRLLEVMQQIHDFIVVDVGTQLNEGALKILEMSDFVFLVSVQSLPCLSNANNMLVSFRNLGYPLEDRTGIVVNRFIKRSNIGLDDVELSLRKKVMWTFPNDYETTVSAINKGQPLTKFAPRQPITESFRQLAESLIEPAINHETKKKKWWQF